MPVLRRRDKQVAFRVSSEEVAAMEAACREANERCISDWVRTVVRHAILVELSIKAPPEDDPMPPRLKEQMERVVKTLEQLTHEVRGVGEELRALTNSRGTSIVE